MSLFDTLYSATDELKELARKPFVKSKLRRSFESAIDSAEMQKIDAERKLLDIQENIKDYDLNEYLRLKEEVDNCKNTIKVLTAHKKEMFK